MKRFNEYLEVEEPSLRSVVREIDQSLKSRYEKSKIHIRTIQNKIQRIVDEINVMNGDQYQEKAVDFLLKATDMLSNSYTYNIHLSMGKKDSEIEELENEEF